MGSELKWNPLVKFPAKHGLEKRTPGSNSARHCSTWRFQAGVGPAILIYLNLDSAVLGSSFCGRVRSDRFGFSKPLTRDPAALHTLLHYVIPNRHPTPIR